MRWKVIHNMSRPHFTKNCKQNEEQPWEVPSWTPQSILRHIKLWCNINTIKLRQIELNKSKPWRTYPEGKEKKENTHTKKKHTLLRWSYTLISMDESQAKSYAAHKYTLSVVTICLARLASCTHITLFFPSSLSVPAVSVLVAKTNCEMLVCGAQNDWCSA